MKSRNVLNLLFVILASASITQQSSAILPAALIAASTTSKCFLGVAGLFATENWLKDLYVGLKGGEQYSIFHHRFFDYYIDKDGKPQQMPTIPLLSLTNGIIRSTIASTGAAAFRAPAILVRPIQTIKDFPTIIRESFKEFSSGSHPFIDLTMICALSLLSYRYA